MSILKDFGDAIINETIEASRVHEPVVAVVTHNQDPERLGRVKVKYPTLPSQGGADEASRWVPVVSIGAGTKRGWYFIPDVDDEVLVMFEHGNFNSPIVLGALWNGSHQPPLKNSGGNPKRVIMSRTKTRIEFDDEGGNVVIEDGGKKGRITIGGGNITIEAMSGDVALQAPNGTLQINAATVSIKGKNVEFYAGGTSTMTAGGAATLSAKAVLQLVSGGGNSTINNGGTSGGDAASGASADIPDPFGS